MRHPFWKLFLGVGLLGMAGVRSESARAEPLRTSGWLVYWDFDGGEQTIQALNGRLNEISVFAYQFDEQGHLIPGAAEVPNRFKAWKAKQAAGKPLLWVTVVNDRTVKDSTVQKDPAIANLVLADPETRRRHIGELLEVSKEADGLEIDYENLEPSQRAIFSQFLKELALAVHARGQLLAVALEPRTEKQEKNEGPSAYDWQDIAQSVDRVRVMAYFLNYGGGPDGPTAPPEWVDEILHYALPRVPLTKLDIALCLDGIDWPSPGNGTEQLFNEIETRRKTHGKSKLRSKRGEPPHFAYQEGKFDHQVWYEDAESLKEKIRRIQAAKISRVSFWRLGDGDPKFWEWLAAQKE